MVVLRAKVLMVGTEGVGKTTLLQKAVCMQSSEGKTQVTQESGQHSPETTSSSAAVPGKSSYQKNLINSSKSGGGGGAVAGSGRAYMPTIGVDTGKVVPIYVPEYEARVDLHCLDVGGSAASVSSLGNDFTNWMLLENTNGLIFVCDITNEKSWDAQVWLDRLGNLGNPTRVSVANKVDLLKETSSQSQFNALNSVSVGGFEGVGVGDSRDSSRDSIRSNMEALNFAHFETTAQSEQPNSLQANEAIAQAFQHVAREYAQKYRAREESMQKLALEKSDDDW